ncbi:MAG: aspartate dehydrogenase [Thermoplasmata archaeon]|nr:aspartate dehydrogenase [Thermoplasmata archaeon]
MRLGIIGCGAIGSRVSVEAAGMAAVEAVLLNDRHPERACCLAGGKVQVATLERILEECDVLLEAAVPDAVPQVIPPALDRGLDVIVMSSGAFLDREFAEDMGRRAARSGSIVHIPSGAICAIDALRAAAVGSIGRLVITTHKSPGSIRPSAEFAKETGIDLSAIGAPTLIFEGSPSDGIRYFPRNVNVAATVRLAVGPDVDMVLRVIADPTIDRNRHEIEVEGEFGSLSLTLDNLPSDNPGTSELAVLSAVSILRQMLSNVKVGN